MKEMDKLRRLLSTVRINSSANRIGLLSVECLLLIAGGPKSTAQMEHALGLEQGRGARAIDPFITRTRRTGEIKPARMALVKKVRRPGQVPMYHLSVNGWRVLKDCGLL